MQDNQRFFFNRAGPKRAFHPALGVFPIARDYVPEHARKFPLNEVVASSATDETAIKMAASAKWAKQVVRMRKGTDEPLRGPDFPFGRVRSPVLSEWERMR